MPLATLRPSVGRFAGTGCVFIDPGSPWQNAWIGSFNSRFRDELLNGWQFDSLLEARVIIEDRRIDYNSNRPHTAHGDLAPTEFAAQWIITNQPQAAGFGPEVNRRAGVKTCLSRTWNSMSRKV